MMWKGREICMQGNNGCVFKGNGGWCVQWGVVVEGNWWRAARARLQQVESGNINGIVTTESAMSSQGDS